MSYYNTLLRRNSYSINYTFDEYNRDLSGNQDLSGSNLQSAYEGLLESREAPYVSGMLDEKVLTDEDIMCNTNLHTASLFKDLNEKYKTITNTINDYIETEREIKDSMFKIDKSVKTLTSACINYYPEGINGIQEKYKLAHKEFTESQNAILEIIKKKRDALEIELENISRKLNALRKLILTGVNEIIKPEDMVKKMCPICFDKEVSIAYVPCGHTYCRPCADQDRSRYAKCPQCREPINSRIKIFFSI